MSLSMECVLQQVPPCHHGSLSAFLSSTPDHRTIGDYHGELEEEVDRKVELTFSMTTGILSLVVVIFTLSFPESPRWLALKGRYEEARQVIAVIDDVEVDSEHVDFILTSITSINDIYAEKASFTSLFKYGQEKIVYRLLIASATQLYSTMSGSALITYYAETLFTTIGLSHNMSKILGASDLTFKLLCCAIPFFLIERAGRRKLLMISGAGMSTCMVSWPPSGFRGAMLTGSSA